MRKPLVALVLVGTCVGLATPSFAAGSPKLAKATKLVVTDVAGDANGLNTQGGLVPVAPPVPGTPANLKQADILSFSLGRKDDGKKVKALVGTLTTAGPSDKGVDYRIRMSAPGCTTFYLELERSALGDSAYLRHNCTEGEATSGGANFDPIDVVISGSTITWTVPISALPGDVKLGSVLEVKGAQTSADHAAIFPGIDEVITSTSFKIGQ